jgi:hypothetical protein
MYINRLPRLRLVVGGGSVDDGGRGFFWLLNDFLLLFL